MPIRRVAANDPKRCENCALFYRHYYMPKYRDAQFTPTNCGHCYGVRRRTVKPNYVCEHFVRSEDRANQ